jgi:hypothetical protein
MNVYPCGPNGGSAPGDLFETSWQCVEYAARYLFNRGHEIPHYDYGKNFATQANGYFPQLQLVTEGYRQLPTSGDIISMWGPGTEAAGHVAVVSSVTSFDNAGGATISVIEENASPGGQNTITVNGWGTGMVYNGGSAQVDYTQFNWVRLGSARYDIDGDGRSDLAMVTGANGGTTGSGKAEVHGLFATGNFQSRLDVATPWGYLNTTTDPVFIADIAGDGRADLCQLTGVNGGTSGSGKVEVHCLYAAGNFQSRLDVATPWSYLNTTTDPILDLPAPADRIEFV